MTKENLIKLLYWSFFLLTIVLVVWFVFGRSPSAESVALTMLTTFVLHLYHQVTDSHKRLANIEADVRVIKGEIGDLKEMLRGN